MKCHEFEASVPELLRGERNEGKRKELLAHALACENCGALLEAERQLSADLQMLAATQAGEKPSNGVEARLLAAFRENSGARMERAPRCGTIPWWTWAAVAAGVVFFALMLNGLLRKPVPPPQRPAQSTPQREAPRVMNAEGKAPKPEGATKLNAAARQRKTPARTRSPRRVEPADTEVATSFFTLPYAEPLRPDESKRVVRLRVPRSTVEAFGIPADGDRAFEPVTADVLVGEDNVARAVRFIGTVPAAPVSQSPRPVPVNARFVR